MGYTGSRTSRTRDRGFTLAELLVVLCIATLLLGLGVPGLRQVLAANRARASVMELHALLQLARSEAVRRAAEVTFCGSASGQACLRDWQGGSLVFVDANRNRRVDSGEAVLARGQTASDGLMRWRGSGGRAYLRFRSDGSAREVGTFTWCPSDNDARYARAVIVSFTGRPRAATDKDRDGWRDDASGNPLSCD